MQICIRKAIGADAPDIAELLRSLGLFERMAAQSEETTREQVGRHLALCQADDSHSVYLAHDSSGMLTGYCAAHWLPYLIFSGPEGYVSELFVRASVRGQNVGTSLLDAVTTEAIERGCCRLSLINIRDRESYARCFYPKRGWVERSDAANFVYHLPTVPY